jgi:hypothetical protein
MRICVPVPKRAPEAMLPPQPRRVNGRVGVIDNSKPRFDLLARSALRELARAGATHPDDFYVTKLTATRAAEPAEIERLAEGAVAVIVGSGD